MHLDHVVRRLEAAAQGDHDALVAERRGCRRPDRVAQVARTVEASLVAGAHRARHDHRLRAIENEVPTERRLLDRVGSLGDDDPVDRRVVQCESKDGRDVEQVCEAQVDRGCPPRSIETISAISSSPGVRARIAAPSKIGIRPPATGSNAVLMVPPVNTTATRAIRQS